MSGGPYCGILCLYAALKAEGVSVAFEDLVDAKYVGSERGSTMAELEAAARDRGAHARGVEGLTAASLRAADHPIILHVRRPGLGTPFNHWVLFLGCEGNAARVVDAPHPVELLPISELLAHWDGTGLVVSREPVAVGAVAWAAWGEAVLLIVPLFLVMLLIRSVSTGRPTSGGRRLLAFARRTIAVLAFAVVAAVSWHLIHDDGLLANPTAVAHVAVRHFAPEVPVVDAGRVAALVGKPGVTVLDVRYPEDYAAGHLPEAVNLPIIAGFAQRREVVGRIPRGNTVVVYCQSRSCKWSHSVAADLVLRGFGNVVIYPGGWAEWEARDPTTRPR
jgi:rhodanese-related sulfurtransferase